MRFLLTGGAGYIGSHVAVELILTGHEVVVIDDFSNSTPEVLNRIKQIAGVEPRTIRANLATEIGLQHACEELQDVELDAAVHLAGLKSLADSRLDPVGYYAVNLGSLLNLIKLLCKTACRNLVFSSSATVYGDLNTNPVKESGAALGVTNPYGRTKLVSEQILQDLCLSGPAWAVLALRYFNPVGAHQSGFIGEIPVGPPNNLFPIIADVATGKREKLKIFGNDYNTPDGTCIRDFIHVVDLAKGHANALEYITSTRTTGFEAINLGTGTGVSVKRAVEAFEEASGVEILFEYGPRRPGDVPAIYADPTKAQVQLGWSAEKTLKEMCEDHWRWQKTLHPKQ